MKLLTKALIIGSLSFAALTQAQAGIRHDTDRITQRERAPDQTLQVAWNNHRDNYSHRKHKTIRHHHRDSDHRYWRNRSYNRYWGNKHYWSHRYQPSYRFGHDYGHSSGAIIFRW